MMSNILNILTVNSYKFWMWFLVCDSYVITHEHIAEIIKRDDLYLRSISWNWMDIICHDPNIQNPI